MPTILHVAHETEVWAGLVQMHASSMFVYLLVEIAHGGVGVVYGDRLSDRE